MGSRLNTLKEDEKGKKKVLEAASVGEEGEGREDRELFVD